MKFGKYEKPIFIRSDSRGTFSELVNFGKWESLISGVMKKGAEMGYHYHQYTILFFYLISGEVDIKTLNLKNKKKLFVSLISGEGYIFRPEEVRVIRYKKKSQFLIMKSHKYEEKDPDLIQYEGEV